MGSRNECLKIKILESALKGELYLSIPLFLFMVLFSLLIFMVVGLSEGSGLWFGIFGIIGTIFGNYFFARGRPGNPLRSSFWGLVYPYGRVLEDRKFSKMVEEYLGQIHSKIDPRPLRVLTFLPPIGMTLISLNSAALRLDLIVVAAMVGVGYGVGAWPIIEAQTWHMARNPRRISQFFGVSESKWKKIDLMGPPVPRPPSVTYISIPFIAVGAFGILASLLTIFRVPPFITQYNPVAFGALYVFISACILLVGRWLLQMRKEGALLVGFSAFCVLLLSLLVLVKSFVEPISLEILIKWDIPAFLGLCISLPTLWVLKKHWEKFSRGLGQFTTIGEPVKKEK